MYKFLQERKGLWRVKDNSSISKLLWKVKAPAKCLNLVWRALSKCLPTLSQLQQKQVNVQGWCPVCLNNIETITHALVDCPFAENCWRSLNKDLRGSEGCEFAALLENSFARCDLDQREEMVTLCWALWRARNDTVWNQKTFTVNRVVA